MKSSTCGLLAAVICLTCAVSMSAQSDNVLRNPQVSKAAFAITPPLRDLVKNQPTDLQFGYHQAPAVQRPKLRSLECQEPGISKDAAAQTENLPADTIPV